ncbi:MAG: hypothetical protein GX595_12110 [Lentisphaerae bacterium]|nr:hypothetical protein [Lentisphaerota bacterium]
MKTTFLAVATGQNVANLPPIIELAEPGDRVLWVVSPEAERGRWADGGSAVLGKRGLVVLPPARVEDINDPRALLKGVQEPLHRAAVEADRLMVVLNGGQKLTPIGLQVLVNRVGIESSTLLYGQSQPAELWLIDPDSWHVERRAYTRTMALPEVLASSQYAIINAGEARQVWPRLANGRGPCAAYPEDADEANRFHRDHHTRNRATHFELFAPDYDELEKLLGADAVEAWAAVADYVLSSDDLGSCRPLYEATARLLGCDAFVPHWSALSERSKARIASGLEDIVNQARKWRHAVPPKSTHPLRNRVYCVVRCRLREESEGRMARRRPHQGIAPIGPAFESAVERRLISWLEQERGAGGAIAEAWASVQAGAPETNRVNAEFDLILVLANAILVHLECKSFSAEQKDLDARLTTLQATASRLAEMVVVGPVFSQFAGEDWMRHVEVLRSRVDGLGRARFVPFTLPGQPESYVRQTVEGGDRPITVPPFERSLSELLSKYRRPSS